MSKQMMGLLGTAVLLLSAVLGSGFLNRSQAQVVDLSYESMAQLIGGADLTQGSTKHGKDDANTLKCKGCTNCKSTDWEKRTYYNCKTCSPGGKKYTPQKNWWYERLHECYTTSEGCKKRVSQQHKRNRVCMTQSGTCL